MKQQELYIKRLKEIRDKLVDLQKDMDEVIQDSHLVALTKDLASCALERLETDLTDTESDDILNCVYNSWSGFDGKEICGAGWLVCKGNMCPSYHPESSIKN